MTSADPSRDEIVGQVRASLTRRIWLRFHTALLVGSAVGVGVLVSTGLQGVDALRSALAVRYGLACLLGYFWFLIAVRWWVRYVAGIRPAVGCGEDDEGRFDPAAEPREDTKQRPKSDWWRDLSPDAGCTGDLDGCLVAVGVILAILALVWFLSFGSAVLVEIVADTLLAGGLVQWARRTEEAWVLSAFRATRVPFVVIATLVVALGMWAEASCPGATRFGEVWGCLSG